MDAVVDAAADACACDFYVCVFYSNVFIVLIIWSIQNKTIRPLFRSKCPGPLCFLQGIFKADL